MRAALAVRQAEPLRGHEAGRLLPNERRSIAWQPARQASHSRNLRRILLQRQHYHASLSINVDFYEIVARVQLGKRRKERHAMFRHQFPPDSAEARRTGLGNGIEAFRRVQETDTDGYDFRY